MAVSVNDLSPDMQNHIRAQVAQVLREDNRYNQLTQSAAQADLVDYVAAVARAVGEALGYILTIPFEYAFMIAEEFGTGFVRGSKKAQDRVRNRWRPPED